MRTESRRLCPGGGVSKCTQHACMKCLRVQMRTHHSEISGGDKADGALAFRVVFGNVPDLDELVGATCGETALDMGVDVDRGGGAVVRGEGEAGLDDGGGEVGGESASIVVEDKAVLERDLKMVRP